MLAAAAVLAACSPADHAYYARGKLAQAVKDGFAATEEYERYLYSRKAPPSSAADLGLTPRSGTVKQITVEKDRIVLVLDSNLPTGKIALPGKRITFSATETGGKRVWSCARPELPEGLMPENCRG